MSAQCTVKHIERIVGCQPHRLHHLQWCCRTAAVSTVHTNEVRQRFSLCFAFCRIGNRLFNRICIGDNDLQSYRLLRYLLQSADKIKQVLRRVRIRETVGREEVFAFFHTTVVGDICRNLLARELAARLFGTLSDLYLGHTAKTHHFGIPFFVKVTCFVTHTIES